MIRQSQSDDGCTKFEMTSESVTESVTFDDGQSFATCDMMQVKAALCYDRPPAHFAPTPLAVTHELLQRLGGVLRTPVHPQDCIAAKCAADDAAEVPVKFQEMGLLPHAEQHNE